MKLYYRVSNNSNDKLKLEGISKELCLKNALIHFQPYVEEFLIVADNVTDPSLIDYLHEIDNTHHNVNIEYTSLGNAGSFWHLYQKALTLPDDTQVYFLEDDYIHKDKSFTVLTEGLQRADYVTLYDHLDMYTNHSEGGDNPYIEHGGEITRVILTPSSHFKLTISTTLTFATTVETLKNDFDIWNHFTGGIHVSDFHAFVALKQKGKSLITCIPGLSTHACIGYLSPLTDWETEMKQYI
jgi:hypothetical protein